MKSAPRVLALMGACTMAAAALQGTAVASTPDAATAAARVSSGIQARTLGAAVAPDATATFLGGYAAGFPGANKKTVSTMTVNKTGACGAADKGVIDQAYHLGATSLAGAFAYSVCLDGEAAFFVTLEATGQNAVVPEEVTEAGDKLVVTITESASATKVKVQNQTQQWQATGNFAKVNVEEYQVGIGRVFLVADPDNPLPLPKFGTTAFTGNTVGGATLGANEPVKVNLVNEANVKLATASNIAANGKDFTVKFNKAS